MRRTYARPLLAVLVATATPLVATSAAHAACAVTPSAQTFLKLGDGASYTLLSGASFEQGSTGWTLGGASVVSGNESSYVGSSKDAKSLAVPATAKTYSPVFCVGVEHPTFRLFAHKTSGTWATMLVKVRWWQSNGAVNETTLAALDGSAFSKWAATKPIALATSLPLWQAGQSVSAQIVLDPEDSGGAWQVDDIYVDPYRRS